jgi:peptide/nickel transport system permease protein
MKLNLGVGLLTLFAVAALFGPALAPHAPVGADLDHRMLPPDWTFGGHFLGTDENGVDLLSQLLYGARVAFQVSVLTVMISASVGVALGMLAGYAGGAADEVLMRIVDVLLAFPGLLLNLAIVAVVRQPSVWLVIFALSMNGWVGYARVARGQVLALREREFVEAARAVGAGPARVLFRHLLPNLMAPLLVQVSLGFGGVIATEASLSFLGVGPQLGYSWGALLARGGDQLWRTGRLALIPGVAIAVVVVGCNLVGDALRDRWNPREAAS